jgi:hypothetical protein
MLYRLSRMLMWACTPALAVLERVFPFKVKRGELVLPIAGVHLHLSWTGHVGSTLYVTCKSRINRPGLISRCYPGQAQVVSANTTPPSRNV